MMLTNDMIKGLVLPLVVTMALTATIDVKADYVVGYFKIENDPTLNVLRIRSESFRGESKHRDASKKRKELENRDVFLVDGTHRKSYLRSYKLNGQQVEVKLTITPPSNRGFGGANYSTMISVRIDGLEKINIPFGYHAHLNNLNMKQITLYGDGVINYRLSCDRKGGSPDLLDYSFFDSIEARKKKLTTKLLIDLLKQE